MNYDPRLWSFIADMNYDGLITISDIWLWFKWLYFYPGDGLVYFLLNGYSPVGRFFEMSYESYGGVFSGITSFFVWVCGSIIILIIILAQVTRIEEKEHVPPQYAFSYERFHEEKVKDGEKFNPDRELCFDEACIGVLDQSGICSECGRTKADIEKNI